MLLLQSLICQIETVIYRTHSIPKYEFIVYKAYSVSTVHMENMPAHGEKTSSYAYRPMIFSHFVEIEYYNLELHDFVYVLYGRMNKITSSHRNTLK